MFTAQQNITQRGHDEQRDGLSNISDVNRGNFLELIHLRCKDIACLKDKLYSQLQKHAQWISPVMQNELLQINNVNVNVVPRSTGTQIEEQRINSEV